MRYFSSLKYLSSPVLTAGKVNRTDDVTISRKKQVYAISEPLRRYLREYQRESELPLSYADLKAYSDSVPLMDKDGKDTLWQVALYPQHMIDTIYNGLRHIYAQLKSSGNTRPMEHLFIERIDYCSFGNTHPFRVKIVNRYNDVYDYFYLKVPDASRIYGLELEHTLSPNQLNYLVDGNTLVEQHIHGIPGDMFTKQYMNREGYNPKRIAKEFVKFNERCFVRLLGDMRAYNFVVEITPDFDDFHFRLRPIDFDQQCYEGQYKVYLPQFFKENYPFVQLVMTHFNPQVVEQYQQEERSLIVNRIKTERYRLKYLREAMSADPISTPEKIQQLAFELSEHYNDSYFLKCNSMAWLLDHSLKRLIRTVNM